MAYIDGFEYDIFISYAHVDNLVASGESPWVEQFHEKLEIALAKRIGRMGLVKIWRDKRLDPAQFFDQTIQTAIEKSAIFLALTSHAYLESDYCQQELQMFYKKAQAESYNLQIGDFSRIYNILLNNFPPSKWPSEYGRISGHPFYDAKDADDLGEPTDQTERSFQDQLVVLKDSLCNMLLTFKEVAGISKTEKVEKEIKGSQDCPSVFFADVIDSLRPVRARVISELERQGINILTDIPPPYAAKDHEAKVKSVVQKTKLSIHLLDHLSGREIDGEPDKTYTQKQIELAKDHANSQLIWVPKSFNIKSVEEANHKNFINKLENGERAESSYDFVRGTSNSLAPQIIEKLNQLQTSSKTNGNAHAVLLDTHLKDQIYTLELSRFLLENNIQPFINPQEDDPNKNMDLLEARLREVTMLMIIYGSVNENWVRQRLGVALQLSVIKNLPVKSYCVYAVPPAKKDEDLNFNFGAVQVKIIDNSKSTKIDNKSLIPILQSMRGGGTT